MDDQRKCHECGRVIHSDRGVLRAERNRFRTALQGLIEAYGTHRDEGIICHARDACESDPRELYRAWTAALDAMALDAMAKGGSNE
jgi:phospholipase/lecithinase/hemolysin